MKLTAKEKNALNDYKDNLRKYYPAFVQEIILFGSKARGNYHRHSDIDIVVITNKKPNRNQWKGMIEIAVDPMIEYEVEISPRILAEKEFKEWSPFIENVKKDGIKLWSQKKEKNLLG